MSNFFEKSDLSRNNAENIISDTLKKCDEIFLFKDGNISSSGSFSKLYNKSQDFKTLVELYKLDEYSKGRKLKSIANFVKT